MRFTRKASYIVEPGAKLVFTDNPNYPVALITQKARGKLDRDLGHPSAASADSSRTYMPGDTSEIPATQARIT